MDSPSSALAPCRASKGKPPKNGKIRRVPLFGMHESACKWLELLTKFPPKNPFGLLRPGKNGGRIPRSKTYYSDSTMPKQNGRGHKGFDFRDVLKAAGIERRVRWHDLRHPCAPALVAGWRAVALASRRGARDARSHEHQGHRTLRALCARSSPLRRDASSCPPVVHGRSGQSTNLPKQQRGGRDSNSVGNADPSEIVDSEWLQTVALLDANSPGSGQGDNGQRGRSISIPSALAALVDEAVTLPLEAVDRLVALAGC